MPAPNDEVLLTQWTSKQARQVQSMITKQAPKVGLGKKFNIVEVFSPPML